MNLPSFSSVTDYVAFHADASSDVNAISSENVRLSYSEVADEVGRYARALQAAGVGPGTFVGVLGPCRPECFIAFLACCRIGATYAGLNPRLILPEPPARDPAPRVLWPDWLVWEPNKIWCWDVTHFPRARRAAFAIVDVVSRRWIDTLVSVEETSTQVRVLFDQALAAEGLTELITPERVELFEQDPTEPILLACSDNGPQMTSKATRDLFAGLAVAQRLGRPRTPTDQAWIESLFGHVKAENPHLEAIRDPDALQTELRRARRDYNRVRLHAGIGYVTPDDEHTGRGDAIRQARTEGLRRAHQQRLDYHRRNHHNNNPQEPA